MIENDSSSPERARTTRTTSGKRPDRGRGCYRRRIDLSASGSEVRGELGDDFHHFAVAIRHDGGRVDALSAEPIRIPWTTCPGALTPLQRMMGVAIDLPLPALTRHTPARQQCTHLHDLTCLAIAHAHRARHGELQRRYDVAIPDRVERRADCVVACDGREVLAWSVEGLRVTRSSVARYEGLRIGSKPFREAIWGAAMPDEVEAAWVLQRGIFIGLGRQHDFDAMQHAREFAEQVGGSCHAFAPERLDEGRRVLGNVHDFTADPDGLLARELGNARGLAGDTQA